MTAIEQGRFRDVAAQSGLAFRCAIPGKRPINILQAMGGGCAFLDFNNDGNLDILLVSPTRVALYQGDGHGKFTDVTVATGLSTLPPAWWMGCAVGDYDNDGYDDIYISAYRGGVLLHNLGGRRFLDVTRNSGIASQPWGTSCTFGDFDNDGKLDLFIGNYVKFGPDAVQLCNVKTLLTGCSPTVYNAEHGVLYHNEGGGRFRDVTRQTRANQTTGKALGAVFFDAEGMGRQSLYIANDEVESDLLSNVAGGFKNVSELSGVGYTETGKPYGGMGVDYGDVDGDGRIDLVVGTFTLENKLILLNQGGGCFADRSVTYQVAAPTLPYLTFGTKLLDFDNDGYPDILFANGYIADNIAEYEPRRAYREPTLLFKNEAGKRFTDLSRQAGADLQRAIVGRGLATGDFDNDGRMDALVVDADGPPLLLHNETAHVGSYLTLRLIGTRSNRNGYGALVTVEAGGRRQTLVCHADGSYLSSSDSRVHVGLGQASFAKITVRWPAGGTNTVTADTVNKTLTIREQPTK